MGAILGGALAPMIATALVARFGSAFAVSVYIALACLITIISITLLGETRSQPPAADPASAGGVVRV